MFDKLPFLPEQASTFASRVDLLFFFLVGLSALFTVLIGLLVAGFAIRYRRRSESERPAAVREPLALELTWTIVPLVLVSVVFVWSARLFVSMNRPPKDAMEIHVVGKRWMWKVQHMTGQREINELHVPVGVPVRISLTSEDVIHSFFVPAFRIKKDAVPGRYQTTWFTATKPGRYHLFCAEYCGTKHSGMIGWVEVMEPARFQEWLSGSPGGSLAAAGEKLFGELACITCHRTDSLSRAPSLVGLFGKEVKLTGGSRVVADETYIRESIVAPTARLVEGYPPIMPAYKGLVGEEQLLELLAYIRSLAPPAGGAAAGDGPPPASPGTSSP